MAEGEEIDDEEKQTENYQGIPEEMGGGWRDMIWTSPFGCQISQLMPVYVEKDGMGDSIESCSQFEANKNG